MQASSLDTSFAPSLVPPDPHANGFGQGGLNNSDTTRSQSRSTDSSTDGSQQSAGAQTDQTASLLSSSAQIPNLNVALQQASSVDMPAFPNFNNPDLFAFQNNSLLPYPMLSQFGRPHQSFDTKPDVGQLQMQMREAKPYKCTQCVKSFANSSYLSQHMRIHLGIKPFGPCQYCGKKFTQLSHLQQHIRTHTGEKPYKCKYNGCEKAFSQLSNLQSHSRCHQTDKPFKCNSCYKCFSDEQSLLEHIPKHKESKHLKVHICPFCGKSYTQATYLQKHMTKHADRTRATGLPFRPDFPTDSLDMNNLWGNMPAMGDNSHDAQQFAINQFANQAMMSQVTGQAPYNAANSAFSLLNFGRGNRFGFEQAYQNNIKPERPTGFNMITPLENIQRYTQQGGSTATTGATTHQQFPIINHMKPPTAY